jgi:hypothetical protein
MAPRVTLFRAGQEGCTQQAGASTFLARPADFR